MADNLRTPTPGAAGASANTTAGLVRLAGAAAGVLVLVLLYTVVPGYTALPPIVLFALAVLCFLPATGFVRWLRTTRARQPGTVPGWMLATGLVVGYFVNLVWGLAILYLLVSVVLGVVALF